MTMRYEDELTPVWKALADPTRRGILDLLRVRPQTTGELCAAFPHLSRFAVMKHLGVLEAAHLVLVRTQGRERWNHLNAVPLQQIYERWLRPYEASWATALLQLKHFVEASQGESAMSTSSLPAVTLRTLHVEQEVFIQAAPAQVFAALTTTPAAWWGAPYLITDNPKTIKLEPRVGGRFFEVSNDGGGYLWAVVTAFRPGAALELTGPLGMANAVHSVLNLQVEAKDAGTIVKLSHRAMGEISPEQQANYNAGWQDLIGARLKRFVETGERLGIG